MTTCPLCGGDAHPAVIEDTTAMVSLIRCWEANGQPATALVDRVGIIWQLRDSSGADYDHYEQGIAADDVDDMSSGAPWTVLAPVGDERWTHRLWPAVKARGVTRGDAVPRLYDLLACLPTPGNVYLWEPDLPHARTRLTVTKVMWNGDEHIVWAVNSQGIETCNHLSRWVEATVLETVPEGEE